MMRDVPKFVVKRLQESAAVETHPDADLLTGFVEKSLLESERNRVMEHLARCNACRETVALALPASEDVVAITSVKPTRNSWFSWPALGWTVATVAIIAITFIGIRHYRLRTNETSTQDASNQVLLSRNETTRPPNLAAPPPQTSPNSLQIAPRGRNADRANSPRKTQPNRQEPFSSGALDTLSKDTLSKNGLSKDRVSKSSLPKNGLPKQQPEPPSEYHWNAGGGIPAGAAAGSGAAPAPKVPENAASSNPTSNPTSNPSADQSSDPNSNIGSNAAQEATVPPSSQTVEVEAAVASAPARSGKKVSGQSASDQKTASKQKAVNDQTVGDEKNRTLTNQSSREFASKNFAAGAAPLRWSISSEGALQRSLDAGHTWVDVNPGQALPQSTTGSNEIAREFNKSAAKKSDASSNPVFRAVAALGNEVWAGGSAGMLYHSSDSGVHWTRVIPVARGATLTGDISSVDFSDAQHGAITTSTGEVWITSDAGRTWERH